jgi:precorrin-6B methylase 2
MICLWASHKKIRKNIFFASLKSMKKGIVSGVGCGSGSISERYGSGDPDPRQKVTSLVD